MGYRILMIFVILLFMFARVDGQEIILIISVRGFALS